MDIFLSNLLEWLVIAVLVMVVVYIAYTTASTIKEIKKLVEKTEVTHGEIITLSMVQRKEVTKFSAEVFIECGEILNTKTTKYHNWYKDSMEMAENYFNQMALRKSKIYLIYILNEQGRQMKDFEDVLKIFSQKNQKMVMDYKISLLKEHFEKNK